MRVFADMNVLVFGGTSEGREICEFLNKNNIPVTLSVATDYGRNLIEPDIAVISGRLSEDEISGLIGANKFSLVIDATHPYAVAVTKNIKEACETAGISYIRLIRQKTNRFTGAEETGRTFESHCLAAEYLNNTNGNILLTIGSKEIGAYTKIKNFENRLFVRILPMPESLNACLSAGIKNSNIICAQGPFSKEMNIEFIKHTNAKFIVAKDSGEAGGLNQRLEAANETGARPVVISRGEESGFTYGETVCLIKEKLNIGAAVKRFPFFIDISDKQVVVIGGGAVSERRIKRLLDFNCTVTVVSPDLTEGLEQLADVKSIKWIKREYSDGDLNGAFFVIAATNDRSLNKRIGTECRRTRTFVSISDSMEESGVWFPAIAEGSGIISGIVSTDGNHRYVKQTAERIRNILKVGE